MEMDLMSTIFPIPPGLPPLAVSNDLAIVGEAKTGKTSFLMQAAVELLTKHPQLTIVYMGTTPMTGLPFHVHLMSKFNIDVGKRLFIYYFNSTDELINFISQYHARACFPVAFMVDNLHHFISHDFTKWVRTNSKPEILSLIIRNVLDLAAYIRGKSGNPCYVYIASQEVMRSIANLDSSDDEPHVEETPSGLIYSCLSVYMSYLFKVEGKARPNEFVLVNEANSISITYAKKEAEIHLRTVDRITQNALSSVADEETEEHQEVPGHRRR